MVQILSFDCFFVRDNEYSTCHLLFNSGMIRFHGNILKYFEELCKIKNDRHASDFEFLWLHLLIRKSLQCDGVYSENGRAIIVSFHFQDL